MIDREARRLLPGRIILEGRQELADIGFRRDHQEGVVEQPVVITVGRDVGALVRIEPEIENHRHPQVGEGLGPHLECSRHPLLGEDKFPIVVAQTCQIAVIGEIEELLARAFFLFANERLVLALAGVFFPQKNVCSIAMLVPH